VDRHRRNGVPESADGLVLVSLGVLLVPAAIFAGMGWLLVPAAVVALLSCRLVRGRSGWTLTRRGLVRIIFAAARIRRPAARGPGELRSLSAVLSALRAWTWPPLAFLLAACIAWVSGWLDWIGTIAAAAGIGSPRPEGGSGTGPAALLGALAAITVAAFGYLWRTRTLRLATARAVLIELDLKLEMTRGFATSAAHHRRLVEKGGTPFIAVDDPGDRILDEVLTDFILLPRAVIAPVVRFYELDRAVEALLRDMRRPEFCRLETPRKLTAVQLLYDKVGQTVRMGAEARRRLLWYLNLRPVWPL